MRFDKLEYDCLRSASSEGFGYYASEEHTKRYLLLMEEGYIKNSPQKEWFRVGVHLNREGEKYWKLFLKKLREKHGHVWKTNKDTQGEKGKWGSRVDVFALSEGNHNGPECKKCGFSFCQHCKSEFEIEECVNK
jgi:hypothetical protein